MRRNAEQKPQGIPPGPPCVTLLDLVRAVSQSARDELEVIATIQHMLETRSVLLLGEFREDDIATAS